MALNQLKAEIAQCLSEGVPIELWWRDDDLIGPSAEFEKLSEISTSLEIPVLCSIIPKQASNNLNLITNNSFVRYCQHGFAHLNHETNLQFKSEFGSKRTRDDVMKNILDGQKILQKLDRLHFEPVFVPPWNRYDHTYLSVLDDLGFTHLSCYGFNSMISDSYKVQFINTHLDITYWGEDLAYLRPNDEIFTYLTNIIKEHRLRYSQTKKNEPIGLLSHHRVMKKNDFELFKDVLTTLKNISGLRFIAPY